MKLPHIKKLSSRWPEAVWVARVGEGLSAMIAYGPTPSAAYDTLMKRQQEAASLALARFHHDLAVLRISGTRRLP